MSLLPTINARGLLASRPAAGAANEGYNYFGTDTGILYRSNGSSWDTNSAGFANPMTTAEDIIIGGASGVPTRKAKGSNGTFLGVVAGALAWATPASGGLSSGTSNPGSPSDGDLFYRSDLDLLIRYRSAGTRWVCVCPHTQNIAHQDQLTPVSATHSVRSAYPAALTTDMLIESVAWAVYVNTTNNGTHYWTMTFPNGVTLSTAASSPDVATKLTSTTALSVPLSDPWTDNAVTKVGSPGSLFFAAAYTYRYIAA